jgi:hypothetical protein
MEGKEGKMKKDKVTSHSKEVTTNIFASSTLSGFVLPLLRLF